MKKALCSFILPVLCVLLALSACANPGGGGTPTVAGDTSKFLTGNGIPSNATGADGDLYLDTQNLILYVKTSGAWANVGSLRGPAGSSGSSGGGWLIGSGVPSISLGVAGDLYLDITGMNGYQKQSGSWTVLFSFASGSSWFVGQGLINAPTNPKVGDLFLDLLSTMVYKWSGSGWSQLVAFQVSIPQYIFTPNFISYTLGIAFGQGKFVAVGAAGTIVYTSDGTKWDYGDFINSEPLPPVNPNIAKARTAEQSALHQKAVLRRSAFNHAQKNVSKGIWDGGGTNGEYFDLTGVAYDGSGYFVAVGYDNNTGNGVLLYSPNGIDWTYVSDSDILDNYLYGVTYTNGQFIVGSNGGILVGTPQSDWVWNNIPSSSAIYSAAGDSASTVVFGGSSLLEAWTGSGWTAPQPTGDYVPDFYTILGVAYGSHKFVAVGRGGSTATVLSSIEAVSDSTWVSQDLPLSNNVSLYSIVCGPAGFAAVGSSGIILTSADSVSWAVQNWSSIYNGDGYSFNAPDFYGVTWGWVNGQVMYAVAQSDASQL